MRLRIGIALLIGVIGTGQVVPQEAPLKPGEGLIGTWSIVSIDTPDGQRIPADMTKTSRIEFSADKMTFREGDKARESAYKIDASKTPSTIDLVPADGPHKGKTCLGIWSLDGNTLRLCISEPGNDRPQALTVRGKTRTGMMVLKRMPQ